MTYFLILKDIPLVYLSISGTQVMYLSPQLSISLYIKSHLNVFFHKFYRYENADGFSNLLFITHRRFSF